MHGVFIPTTKNLQINPHMRARIVFSDMLISRISWSDNSTENGPAGTCPTDTGPAVIDPIETGLVDTGPDDTGPTETGPADTGSDVTGTTSTSNVVETTGCGNRDCLTFLDDLLWVSEPKKSPLYPTRKSRLWRLCRLVELMITGMIVNRIVKKNDNQL